MGPMMMDVIYAGITAEDVTGDGRIDLIAADRLGNIVCFDGRGSEQWEARVEGEVYSVRSRNPQLLVTPVHSCYSLRILWWAI